MSRNYPVAERSSIVDEMHGIAVPDPYRWLEDPSDPRTQEWVQAQGEITDSERQGWSMRAEFARSVEALLGAGAVSLPVHRGERVFFTRRQPGQQFGVLYVRDANGNERVLIDPMELDPTGATTLDFERLPRPPPEASAGAAWGGWLANHSVTGTSLPPTSGRIGVASMWAASDA